ncbi:hypothetical protein LCGC14_1283730 [marine sediment metagenome]|uniref:Uncharacterized protein n=1 Tax=marine sediment metagenome TaxID=412755 RepID=A0A0F9LFI7_9ZZZZ
MYTQIDVESLQALAELSYQDRCRIVSPDFKGPVTELNIIEESARVDLEEVDLIDCRYLPKSVGKLLGANELGELVGVLFVPVGTEIAVEDTIAVVTLKGVNLVEPLLFDIEGEPEIGHVQVRVPLKTTQMLAPS